MIGKNYNYNGFDMTDRVAIWLWFALQDVDITTVQRQNITDNANDHWSKSSRTLESGRLFSFVWLVSCITKEARGVAWELITNAINIEPFMNTEYLHNLTFQTDQWEDRQVKVLVKSKPKWTNWLHKPEINFTFELYAPWNELYGVTKHIINWSSAFFGGTSFSNNFGDSRWEFSWDGVCINQWNYKAGCTITINWTLVNPMIKNITNWLQYKINGTTNNLVLDSKDWWTVEDNWVDISNLREYWSAILLSPWTNTIWVFSDGGTATFTVERYDAWNTI